MSTTIRSRPRSSVGVAIVAAALLASCIIVADDDATLTIHNHSSFALTEVHLAPVGDPNWGPNLLPSILPPGGDLVLTSIACDRYDVLVVDETGVDCMLTELSLCFHDRSWVITNSLLAYCAFD